MDDKTTTHVYEVVDKTDSECDYIHHGVFLTFEDALAAILTDDPPRHTLLDYCELHILEWRVGLTGPYYRTRYIREWQRKYREETDENVWELTRDVALWQHGQRLAYGEEARPGDLTLDELADIQGVPKKNIVDLLRECAECGDPLAAADQARND